MDIGNESGKRGRLFIFSQVSIPCPGSQGDRFPQMRSSTYFFCFCMITDITYFNLEIKDRLLLDVNDILVVSEFCISILSVVWCLCRENHEPRHRSFGFSFLRTALGCKNLGGRGVLRSRRQVEFLKSSNSSTWALGSSLKKVRQTKLGMKKLVCRQAQSSGLSLWQ